jgi:hypothetical protein
MQDTIDVIIVITYVMAHPQSRACKYRILLNGQGGPTWTRLEIRSTNKCSSSKCVFSYFKNYLSGDYSTPVLGVIENYYPFSETNVTSLSEKKVFLYHPYISIHQIPPHHWKKNTTISSLDNSTLLTNHVHLWWCCDAYNITEFPTTQQTSSPYPY